MTELGSDRALTDPAGDRLGYADLSRAIASALSYANPHDRLVVAIHGPWGSGESTVLNFVEFVLAADQSEIARFNPWWSSGQEALTRNFLFSSLWLSRNDRSSAQASLREYRTSPKRRIRVRHLVHRAVPEGHVRLRAGRHPVGRPGGRLRVRAGYRQIPAVLACRVTAEFSGAGFTVRGGLAAGLKSLAG
jgi:hypothetical protein